MQIRLSSSQKICAGYSAFLGKLGRDSIAVASASTGSGNNKKHASAA